ncbi:uncharacterized protein LOC144166406 [Haemaphysalis longicornis]
MKHQVSALILFGVLFPASTSTCSFEGLDVERLLNEVIKQLPHNYSEPGAAAPLDLVPGFITVEAARYSGFDLLRPFGPLHLYCRNETRMVQLDLMAPETALKITRPWKTCYGKTGVIISTAGARVTVTFKVVNATNPISENDASGSFLMNADVPAPVSINSINMYLQGGGEVPEVAFSLAWRLFPGGATEVWHDVLKWRLYSLLNNLTSVPPV